MPASPSASAARAPRTSKRQSAQAIGAELDASLLALPDARAALAQLEAGLRRRGLVFGKQLIPTYLRPHLIDAKTLDAWAAEAEALFELLEELAARALVDRELTRFLDFSDEAMKLFEIDPGFRRSVIVARPDAVYSGGRARYVEANTDSPAMMTFADEIESLLLELEPLERFSSRLQPAGRSKALLDALLDCYREWGGKGRPSMAVVDWPGEKTAHELKVTVRTFNRLGVEAVVCTPAELSYRRGRLYAGKKPLDMVYRRVLFNDFLARADELEPLISAYRDGKVCMANPLRSYLVGSKALFALLHDAANPAGLSPAQRELARSLVPWSVKVTPKDRVDRRRWVLKKSESHGGQDVVIGNIADEGTWAKALSRSRDESWIRQEYLAVPTIRLPMLEGNRLVLEDRMLNWNPFIFGGKHGGSISRVSSSVLINITLGGGLLPTMRVA